MDALSDDGAGRELALCSHLQRWVGDPSSVIHDALPIGGRIDVLCVPPSGETDWWTLVTSGMSAIAQEIPEAKIADGFPRAELVMMLPPEIRISAQSWPVKLLRSLARLPRDQHTWLGYWHGIPNGDPALPYAEDTAFCAAAILPPIVLDDGFRTVSSLGGDIELLAVIPLHRAEWEAKLSSGIDALLPGFEAHGVNELCDPQRSSVV